MIAQAASSAGLGGVHHVTALSSDPAATVEFYAGVLGLRLVKRTVNYDDPSTWQLYFGDAVGTPGSILTFFPHPGARRGRRGGGEAVEVALSVPVGALGFWSRRLRAAEVTTREILRFGEPALVFEDPDGLTLELVERPVSGRPRLGGDVPEEFGVRAIEGIALALIEDGPTESLLARRFGYARADREDGPSGARVRLIHASGGIGAHVDLLTGGPADPGRAGAGSIHHVAFRARDDVAQAAAQAVLREERIAATDVRDRNYFRSIYFREPGGVLFEVATDGPGFRIDESAEALGTELRLPRWLEARRAEIERALPPLRIAAEAHR